MLIQGRALKEGAVRRPLPAAYWSWWFRSSLLVLGSGAGLSLLLAALSWVALKAGGSALLPTLTGSATPESSPARELLAGWVAAFFSSQLTPLQLPAASPPGLGFGLGSPAILVAVVVVAFRAGMRLENAGLGPARGEAALRAAGLGVGQALACAALLLAARFGGGALAGTPGLFAPLPALLVAAAAAGGAIWRRERTLGRAPVAGARGIAVAAAGLLLAAAGAGVFAVAALLVQVADGRLRLAGGAGTVLLGLLYLPNLAALAVALGLGGGPQFAVGAEPVACTLVCLGCLAASLTLNRRQDRIEQAFFAVAFPLLVLLAAIDSRPLVSDHTLGFTPGVAFWVAIVVSGMAAAAGPELAGTRFGRWALRQALLREPAGLLPAPAAEESRAVAAGARAFRLPRDRMGAAVLGVTAVVMLAMILLVGAVPPPTTAGPQEAAQAYLAAESGSGGTWNLVSVDRSQLPAAASTALLSPFGAAEMAGLEQNRPGSPAGVRVVTARESAGGASVTLAYTLGGSARTRTFELVREGAGWKVRIAPALLQISAPGQAGLSVDGAPVAAGAPVAVLPGFHRVTAAGSALWQPAATTVEASAPAPAPTPVSVQPPLTNQALTAAIGALQKAFAPCLASSAASPAGCPQSIAAPAGAPVRWQLVGDPSAGASYGGVDESTVAALGHFQMIGAFDVHLPEGVRHLPSSGGFRALLTWTGNSFAAATPAAAPAPALVRPPITDAALKDAVAAGFQACLASDKLRPADCPQTVPSSLFITEVQWSQAADPLAGATIVFDGAGAQFHVSGTYAMNVTYRAGGKPASDNSSGGYRADLFWDGGRPVLVQIVRTG